MSDTDAENQPGFPLPAVLDNFRHGLFGNVLIVHHTSVGSKDRARGNSALKGALDAKYMVVKSNDEVTITAKKMKDADEPEPISH